MEAVNKKIVEATFDAAIKTNGITFSYRSGNKTTNVPGFFVDGDRTAETRFDRYTMTTCRTIVISIKELGVKFSPNLKDTVTVDTDDNRVCYSVLAESGTPIWGYWCNDRRYAKIFLKEKEIEA